MLHKDVKRLLSETFRGFTSAGDAGMFIDKYSQFIFGDTYKIGPPGLPEPGMSEEERAPVPKPTTGLGGPDQT